MKRFIWIAERWELAEGQSGNWVFFCWAPTKKRLTAFVHAHLKNREESSFTLSWVKDEKERARYVAEKVAEKLVAFRFVRVPNETWREPE